MTSLYEQLGKEKDVANLWSWLADCYGDWGKYEQALESQQQCLFIRQTLNDTSLIAVTYRQLGSIYQAWGKYEQAIAHYQQSRDLYEQLDKVKDVAQCHRAIGESQRLLAKNNPDKVVAFELLAQAEQNIRQAIQINTTKDYKKNLAYDYIIFSLIWSQRVRPSSFDDSLPQEQIAQFEEYYNTGLTYLAQLGQTVNRADKALDIAHVYLEVSVLKNLDRAEELAQEFLQVFYEYNRRKLEAASRKLLGEIYLNRSQHHQSGTEAIAIQFLTESLQIYRELDLSEKAAEVEQLMHANLDNAGIFSD